MSNPKDKLDNYIKNINKALSEKDYKKEIDLSSEMINWLKDHYDLVDQDNFDTLNKVYTRQVNNLIGLLEFEKAVETGANRIKLDKAFLDVTKKENKITLVKDYLDLIPGMIDTGNIKNANLILHIALKLLKNEDFKKDSDIAVLLIQLYLNLLHIYGIKKDPKNLMKTENRLSDIEAYYLFNTQLPKKDRLKVLANSAEILIANGIYDRAEDLLELIRKELKKEDIKEFIDTWSKVGSDYFRLAQMNPYDDPKKLLDLYKISEKIFKKILKEERNQENLLNLINIYLFRSSSFLENNPKLIEKDFLKAIELFQKAIELEHETRFESGLSLAYKNLSHFYITRNDIQKALESIEKASYYDKFQISYFNNPIIISQDIENDIIKNFIYKATGEKEKAKTNLDNIIDRYEEVIAATDNLDLKANYVDFLISEGDYQSLNNNVDLALMCFETAVDFLKEMIHEDESSYPLLDYSSKALEKIYSKIGDLEKIQTLKPLFDEIDLDVEIYDDNEYELVRDYLYYYRKSTLEEENGHPEESIKNLLKANEIVDQLMATSVHPETKFYMATVKAALGRSYFENGKEDEGAKYLEEIIPYLFNSDYKQNTIFFDMLFYSVVTMAGYYLDHDQAKKAQEILEPLLEIQKQRLQDDLTEDNLYYICAIYYLMPRCYNEVGELDKLNEIVDDVMTIVLDLNPDTANADLTATLLDTAYIAAVIGSRRIKDFEEKLKLFKKMYDLLYKKGSLTYKTKFSLFNIDYELAMKTQDKEEENVLLEEVLKIGAELQKEEYSEDIANILDSVRELYLKMD